MAGARWLDGECLGYSHGAVKGDKASAAG